MSMPDTAIIPCGGLGTLYVVRMAGHDPAPPHEAYIPVSGGIFKDFSVHDFDALRFVTGQEVVETYADVTTTAKNPYRRILTPQEACEGLSRFKGQIFDPTVVDVLRLLVAGDDLKHKLLADRRTVLVVDPDPEETTVLELRMIEEGFEVLIDGREEAIR